MVARAMALHQRGHVLNRRRSLLEGPEAVQAGVPVDGRQGPGVGFGGGADDHGFSHPLSRAQMAKA